MHKARIKVHHVVPEKYGNICLAGAWGHVGGQLETEQKDVQGQDPEKNCYPGSEI